MSPYTTETLAGMTDEALCLTVALTCEGYVLAGTFHGRTLVHPRGQRTTSAVVPDYTGSWDACMRLVCQYRMAIFPPDLDLDPPDPTTADWLIEQGETGQTRHIHPDGGAPALRRAITELALQLATEGAD